MQTLRHLCSSVLICVQELFDMIGQLIRRDYGEETLSNVLAQLKAYFVA